MRRLYRAFASVELTVLLCALICLVAAWGSIVSMRNPAVFSELDQAILFHWLRSAEYGPGVTLWIYALIALTSLFALNTFVCTLDRVYAIVKNRRPWAALLPQVVHVGFLIALLGHLVGSAFGFRTFDNVLIEGKATPVPYYDGLSIRLDSLDVKAGRAGLEELKSNVTLIKDGRAVESFPIELNSPLIYDGVAFYHTDQGTMPTGLVIEVDRETLEAPLSGPLNMPDGGTLHFGDVYPDFAIGRDGKPYSASREYANPHIEVAYSKDGSPAAIGYLDLSGTGKTLSLGQKRIRHVDFILSPYSVLAIHKDPGIWLIIAGSVVLTCGMLLLLFTRKERSELVTRRL